MAPSKNHAVVIVLGDSGRSPRMQFHASSLASLSDVDRVSMIGYSGEACNENITNNLKIRDCRLDASTFKGIEFIRSYSSLGHAVVKGVLLVLTLVRLLFSVAGKYTDSTGNLQESIPISFIIIQNPPATPVVLATLLYRALVYILAICTFSNPSHQTFKICIDWHNLGFTLYYDKYKPTHLLVRISYLLEHVMAKVSDLNFCVSAAMQKWLLLNYGISSTVFYDRPPKSVFQKFNAPTNNEVHGDGDCDGSASMNNVSGMPDEEYMTIGCVPLKVRHELLLKLKLTDESLFPSLTHCMHSATETDPDPDPVHNMDSVMTEVTVQTYRHRHTGEVCVRQDRAVVLLSSTSWTPDEDFCLLTKALTNLDKSIAKRRGSESPRKKRDHSRRLCDQRVSNVATRVVVVITGKGPMKEKFMSKWEASQQPGSPSKLRYISLNTVWLEIDDYPLMVGCADMGICLHTSSSGVDLPMKVLDMFGSGVPVCAVSFPALPELVQNGTNGIIFRTSSELSAHLFRLFCDFPHDLNSIRDLKKMKKATMNIGCWEENWADIVQPLVLSAFHRNETPTSTVALSCALYVVLIAVVLSMCFFASYR